MITRLIINYYIMTRNTLYPYILCCLINNSCKCAYPIINEENTALLLYRARSPSEETIFNPRSSWKKGNAGEEGCDYSLRSHVLR